MVASTTASPTNVDTAATSLSKAFYESKENRSALIYHANAKQYANAAWVGRVLPYDPGSATWAFKTLSGVTVDKIQPSQRTLAENRNLNIYIPVGGVDITHPGRMSSGDWIDIVIGIDYMEARIRERVFGLLAGAAKIPYNDVGISVIGAALLGVLTDAANKGIIEQSSIDITLPTYAELQFTNYPDVQNRHLPNIHFTATLIGAIQKVTIRGVVSV